MQVSEVASGDRWIEGFSDAFEWLARLLRDEGVDLMAASDRELARGTPVYVEGDAEVAEVQRRMARKHIRRVPVLRDGQLVGIVDFVDLALMAGD